MVRTCEAPAAMVNGVLGLTERYQEGVEAGVTLEMVKVEVPTFIKVMELMLSVVDLRTNVVATGFAIASREVESINDKSGAGVLVVVVVDEAVLHPIEFRAKARTEREVPGDPTVMVISPAETDCVRVKVVPSVVSSFTSVIAAPLAQLGSIENVTLS